MKKLLFIGLIFGFMFISCKKNEDKPVYLRGIYTEISPIEGRTHFNFISDTTLQIIDEDSTENFLYEIDNGVMRLGWLEDSYWYIEKGKTISTKFSFKVKNDSIFEIIGLYIGLYNGDNTSLYIFKKNNLIELEQ